MADLAYPEVYAMTRGQARLRMVMTYAETRSVSETARRWGTSRQVVRKWLTRFQAEGLSGLSDRSRRPNPSPGQTPPHVEEQVLEAREKTEYGRQRLALYLRDHGLCVSPHTIRHILRRRRRPQKRKPRQPLYPALWAWDPHEPFSLIQTDVKHILDKQALGTQREPPTCSVSASRAVSRRPCDPRTRLRLLAFSHRLNRSNGMAFVLPVLTWLEPMT